MTNLGDVGGWLRTATGVAILAWGPGDDGFGRVSPDADLTVTFSLFRGRLTVVLTDTGMFTGSGLSDHRDRDVAPRSPMIFQEFAGSDFSRRRYWVCSMVGWDWLKAARPGLAHLAFAGLGRHTSLTGVVTQNVDGLHQAAGSEPVVDLHGNPARVVCLDCGRLSGCVKLQVRLLKLNPEIAARPGDLSERARTAPDGGAEVEGMTGFTYPACPVCGGMLKLDAVYFGENTRREVVEAVNVLFDVAEVFLVLGSTLTAMNGLRFARQAIKQGKDVIIVGDGATRADDLATLCIHDRLGHILPSQVDALRAG